MPSDRDALDQLVGSRHVVPSADLPSRLDEVFIRVGMRAGFNSVQEMISRSTLYPYFTFFLPTERKASILNRARTGTGSGLKVEIGLVANRFGASTPLRHCPACVEASAESFGRAIWRREQQLPGVSVCLMHRRPLHETELLQSRYGNRHQLVLPGQLAARPSTARASRLEIKFAALSTELLSAGTEGRNAAGHVRAYRRALSRLGWVRGATQFDWHRLRQALAEGVCGADSFPFRGRLDLTQAEAPAWVRAALGGRPSSVHPICHVALVDALFESVDLFLQDLGQVTVDSYEQRTALLVQREHEERLLRDQTLSCTEAARRLGLCTTTVSLRRKRLGLAVATRQRIGASEGIDELRRQLIRGVSVADAAFNARVSLSKAYRLLSVEPRLQASRAALRIEKRRQSYRSEWEQAKLQLPYGSCRDRRALAPAAYAWLRRNDQDWLLASLPPRMQHAVQERVNWAERDHALSQLVLPTIMTIRELTRPLRATRGEILRRIMSPGSWQHNQTKLPHLKSALDLHAESLEAFKIRAQYHRPAK